MARASGAAFNSNAGSVFLAASHATGSTGAASSSRGGSLVGIIDTRVPGGASFRSDACEVCRGSGKVSDRAAGGSLAGGRFGFGRATVPCEVCEGRGTIQTEAVDAPVVERAGISVSQLAQRLGICRDSSAEFKELRKLCLQRSSSLAGPRYETLRRMLGDKDDKALAKFVQIGRSTTPDGPVEACAWCNARIALRTNAANGSGPGKVCRLCLRWHCEVCRSHVVDLGPLLGSSTLKRPSFVQGLKGQGATDLKSCGKCLTFVQALQWHKLPREAGLAPSSVQLFRIHGELESQMTAFAAALSQFEGLSRLVEEVGNSTELPTECAMALVESQEAATSAQAAVEAAVRSASKVECPPPPHRDARVRDALVRQGKRLTEDLKPRLMATQKRAQPAVIFRSRSMTS